MCNNGPRLKAGRFALKVRSPSQDFYGRLHHGIFKPRRSEFFRNCDSTILGDKFELKTRHQ